VSRSLPSAWNPDASTVASAYRIVLPRPVWPGEQVHAGEVRIRPLREFDRHVVERADIPQQDALAAYLVEERLPEPVARAVAAPATRTGRGGGGLGGRAAAAGARAGARAGAGAAAGRARGLSRRWWARAAT
jgi:hypothetical protein